VACESKGPEAALPFVQAAQQKHPSLLDVDHSVPELFNTRNVPAAFWIDEEGRIVRANDPIYAQRRTFENGAVTSAITNEPYLDAVRDWVKKGSQSQYVQAGSELEDGLGGQTRENVQAMAHFRLGLYLHRQGQAAGAVAQFKRAHELEPDNWNYKRQAWNLGDIEADYGYKNVLEAIRAPGAPQFYRSVELVNGPQQ
jgi:hypothetical protein